MSPPAAMPFMPQSCHRERSGSRSLRDAESRDPEGSLIVEAVWGFLGEGVVRCSGKGSDGIEGRAASGSFDSGAHDEAVSTCAQDDRVWVCPDPAGAGRVGDLGGCAGGNWEGDKSAEGLAHTHNQVRVMDGAPVLLKGVSDWYSCLDHRERIQYSGPQTVACIEELFRH